jgi:hypothetical protein
MGGLERTRERLDWAGFVTREYGLESASLALADMKRQAVLKALIRPDAAERPPAATGRPEGVVA